MSDAFGARLSRRSFLAGSAGLWISASLPRPLAAREASRDGERRTLSMDEWAAVDAIAARIIPTDETPGAREAGCVNFIDKALAHEDADALPLYRSALAALDRACMARFESAFAALPETRQDALLASLEKGELSPWDEGAGSQAAFFATVRMHTILGFVADPVHGGNRDYIGWKTLGFPGNVHHLGGSHADQVRGAREFVPVWDREPAEHGGHQDQEPSD